MRHLVFIFLLILSPVLHGESAPKQPEPSSKPEAAPPQDTKKPESSTTSYRRFNIGKLSPDGKYVAAISYNAVPRDFAENIRLYADIGFVPHARLNLINLDSLEESFLGRGGIWVKDGWERRIAIAQNIFWLNNDWIAVSYGETAAVYDIKGNLIRNIPRRIIGRDAAEGKPTTGLYAFGGSSRDEIVHVNVATNETRRIRFPMPGGIVNGVFDDQGTLRALALSNSALWSDSTKISNWYRDSADSDWRKLAEFSLDERQWTPLALDALTGQIIALTDIGRDTRALVLVDPKTGKIGEVLAGHPTADVVHADGLSHATFRSLTIEGLKSTTLWFDPAWARAQRTVDQALPNRINHLQGDPAGRLLVGSASDVDPGSWYVLDTKAGTLKKIAVVNTRSVQKSFRPMEAFTYAARDGLTIPAYLTRPQEGNGPFPLVVLVHGGPAARDYWGWDYEVQELARNGFAVFQPQFRGSVGFGSKHFESGMQQWGLTMQDDITDGVEFLVKSGAAERGRICIIGSSYGGYAALWGTVKTPGLYQCAASFAGVTDLADLVNGKSDLGDSSITREIVRIQIGDTKADRARFDLVSPLKSAQRFSAPVLLMHGTDDRRVPISHSRKLLDALRLAGKDVEWVEFKDTGHSLGSDQAWQLYFDSLLPFLRKHLKVAAIDKSGETAQKSSASK